MNAYEARFSNQLLQQIALKIGLPFSSARKRYTLDPFTNAIEYLPATASATTSGNFLTQADSAFAVCATTYIATDTSDAAVSGLQPFGSGALTSFAPFLIQINDSGAGRNLANLPIPIDNWFGTGQLPHFWSPFKLINPNSVITVTCQNLSASDRRVRLAFRGYKIFGDDKALEQFVAYNV